MHYLCYQLWGDDPTYTVGMQENISQVRHYYPRHKIIIYKDKNLKIDFPKCTVIDEDNNGWYNYFWRLHAFGDIPRFDTISFRDADSRLNPKEANAFQNWLITGKSAYIMHDHPQHSDAIMAGMWGIKGGILPNLKPMILDWIKNNDINLQYGSDQRFLHQMILPLIRGSLVRYGTRTPYPKSTMENCEYIGQRIIVPKTDDSSPPG